VKFAQSFKLISLHDKLLNFRGNNFKTVFLNFEMFNIMLFEIKNKLL